MFCLIILLKPLALFSLELLGTPVFPGALALIVLLAVALQKHFINSGLVLPILVTFDLQKKAYDSFLLLIFFKKGTGRPQKVTIPQAERDLRKTSRGSGMGPIHVLHRRGGRKSKAKRGFFCGYCWFLDGAFKLSFFFSTPSWERLSQLSCLFWNGLKSPPRILVLTFWAFPFAKAIVLSVVLIALTDTQPNQPLKERICFVLT